MPRPTKYTFSRVRRILKHLRKGGSKTAACGSAGICFDCLNEWEKTKDGFSEAVKRAIRRGEERLVDVVVLATYQAPWAQKLTASMYLLNTSHGYSQKSEITVKGKTGGQSDSFREFIKVLDKSSDEDREAFAAVVERIEGNGGRGRSRIR